MVLELWRGWRGQQGIYGPAIGQLLEGTHNQSHQSFPANPRPGDPAGEPRFHFHQSLGFNKSQFNHSYLWNCLIWFKHLVTEITVVEMHLALWKWTFWKNKIKNPKKPEVVLDKWKTGTLKLKQPLQPRIDLNKNQKAYVTLKIMCFVLINESTDQDGGAEKSSRCSLINQTS